MPESSAEPKKKPNPILPKYRSWPLKQRMAEAVRLVMEEDYSQSHAARITGVSRSRVNVNVGERKKAAAAGQERAAEALARRVAAFESEPLGGVDESPSATDGPPGPGELDNEVSSPGPGVQEVPEGGVRETRRVPPAPEFVRMYFPNLQCPDCGKHHEIEPFQDEILTKFTSPDVRRVLVNVFPYSAKSTYGTVFSTVHQIVENPNSRTAIVSKAEKLSQRLLFQIKKMLTDPNVYDGGPNLIDHWGPFYNQDNWSKNEIYVAGRNSAEKDPTVSVYGEGAQIYGYRFDRMIFDDIADMENQKNPDRIREQFNRATVEYASRVGKAGFLGFVGTRIGPSDVYSLLENLPAFEVIRYPAILDEVTKKVLYPDHLPYAAIDEARRSMTPELFALVYQNTPLAGSGATFPIDVLEKCKDPEHFLGKWDSTWRLVMGVDPAGAGEQAGFTAMVVLAVDLMTGRRFIVDMVNQRQMRAPQIKDQIIAWADQYQISEIRVEVNGLQNQIFQYDNELIQKLTARGIRFVPHVTHKGNKWDPQFGVEGMGPMFYNGQISLPNADINSRKKIGELIEQLAAFPLGTVSDLVMALWFAELGCKEMFQRHKLPAFDQRTNLPHRIARKRRVVDFSQAEVRLPSDDDIANPYRQSARRLVNVGVE